MLYNDTNTLHGWLYIYIYKPNPIILYLRLYEYMYKVQPSNAKAKSILNIIGCIKMVDCIIIIRLHKLCARKMRKVII